MIPALATLLTTGESITLEFKQPTAKKERACRILCACADGQDKRQSQLFVPVLVSL